MDQQVKTKSDTAFRTIGEVAEYLNVEQHVLRFWETKFSQIKPLKRGGGRRYYRPEDVAVLEKIYHLLYNQGYTIKGAQQVLKGQTRNRIAESANDPRRSAAPVEKTLSARQKEMLGQALSSLKQMREMLVQTS